LEAIYKVMCPGFSSLCFFKIPTFTAYSVVRGIQEAFFRYDASANGGRSSPMTPSPPRETSGAD
jgi:hypothetical protein